jgi:Holliday junction resolvasome RuvABC endonuclease subunit
MMLALDCGTRTGWCLLKDGKVHESGVQDFSKMRGESNGVVFLRFRRWLEGMISLPSVEKNKVQFVVYEQAHHRGGPATEICTNLTGRVQETCEEYGLLCAGVHTGSLKKFATGSGRASKGKMCDLAAAILRREPLDDNEADAVHLALYAFDLYGVK